MIHMVCLVVMHDNMVVMVTVCSDTGDEHAIFDVRKCQISDCGKVLITE